MTFIPMKQPDGQWCIFSSVTDAFVLEDAARDEVEEFLLDEQRDRIQRRLDETEAGTKPTKYGKRFRYEDAKELEALQQNTTEEDDK